MKRVNKIEELLTRKTKKTSIDKDKNGEDSPFKNISKIDVTLNKNSSTAKDTRCILIEITLYFSHGNRKITVLLNYKINKNLISQHFTKENNLETTLIKRMRTTVNKHHITIYKSHNIITKIKDSRNEVRATQRTFYATNI